MRRRFAKISLAAFLIQAVVVFFLLHHSEAGYRLVVMAYYTFAFLLAANSGKFGYVLLGVALGAIVYSALLALALACLIRFLHVAPKNNM